MKTWNTSECGVRTLGFVAAGLTLSVACSAALADGAVWTSGLYSGPSSSGFPADTLIVDGFETAERPVGISFEPSNIAIMPGNSVGPGSFSLMIGQWEPAFIAGATNVLFDAAAIGSAPNRAGFVVTESAGFGMPAPVTVTVYFTDGSTTSNVYDILSDADNATDDVFIGVEDTLGVGIERVSIASIIPISIDDVMYTSVASLPVAYVKDDINGDSFSDIAWFKAVRKASTSAATSISLWDSTGFDAVVPTIKPPSLKARAIGLGDTDGDKDSELIWRDAVSGKVWVWTADALSVGVAQVDRLLPGASWAVVGIDDLDGDKRADIVFRRTTKTTTELRVWTLNGSTVASEVLAKLPAAYDQAFVGDMNRDGRAEILLRKKRLSARGVDTFVVTGLDGGAGVPLTLRAAAPLQNADGSSANLNRLYSVAALADVTGDGASDMILRRSNGEVVIWDIDLGKVTAPIVLGQKALPAMKFMATPDTNGDGKRELLFRTANGRLTLWTINGSNATESLPGVIGSVYAPAVPQK